MCNFKILNSNIMTTRFSYVLLSFLLLTSCLQRNPNRSAKETIEEQSVAVNKATGNEARLVEGEVYVPIYSNIYNKTKNEKILLTVTLSIRNTSKHDTLFLQNVDYYDTQGALVKQYLEHPIYLRPLESIDYVIEEQDNTGGSGANFIIDWYASKPIKPIFQAVMIGGLAQQAFTFTTDGVSVEAEKFGHKSSDTIK